MQELELKVNNLKNSKKKRKKLVRGTINLSACESSVQLHCQLTGSSVILTHSIRAQAQLLLKINQLPIGICECVLQIEFLFLFPAQKFFVFIALALIGFAAGAQLPDSATQGPNPQDIATPEPEYIDIEDPAPAAAAPAPARPIAPLPVARPIARPVAIAQSFSRPIVQQQIVQQPIVQRAQYLPPLAQQQLPGHAYSSQAGYSYRRPVYVRRVYRQRRY